MKSDIITRLNHNMRNKAPGNANLIWSASTALDYLSALEPLGLAIEMEINSALRELNSSPLIGFITPDVVRGK
jgi:hypothetical protein